MNRTLLEEFTRLNERIKQLENDQQRAEEVLRFYADSESEKTIDGSTHTVVHVMYSGSPKAIAYFAKKGN